MAKSKSRRPKRRKAKTAASRKKKRAKVRAKSRGKSGKAKRSKRAKPAKRKTKRAASKKRKRTTAEGMRRALKLKQAAEEREHELHPTPVHNWASQIPQSPKPDPVPNNLHEQGDLANILQNTTNRRPG